MTTSHAVRKGFEGENRPGTGRKSRAPRVLVIGALLLPMILAFASVPGIALADEVTATTPAGGTGDPSTADAPETEPSPSATPTPTPSDSPAEPDPEPEPEPSAQPSASPEPAESPSPEATPAPAASESPTASTTPAAGASETTRDSEPAATPTVNPSPGPAAATASTAPPPRTVRAAAAGSRLGTADAFAILAGSTVTNAGTSVVTGDIGLHPGTAVTGFDSCTGPANCVNHTGTMHVTNGVAAQAKADLLSAFNTLVGIESTCTPLAVELGGSTLTPGVYCSPTFGLTGALTLSGIGEFIFLTGAGGSTLVTASGSEVLLINGADSCDVYWQVASSAAIGSGSAFAGNILAAESISFGAGATLDGSALATESAVTMISNTITDSDCAASVVDPPDNGGTPPSPPPPADEPAVVPVVAAPVSPGPAGPSNGSRGGRGDAGLPLTGSPVELLVLLAALALGAGGLMVLLSSRWGRSRAA